MAGTTRIEELQKKFDENPRRYFAPLANEYRKAGELDQAIAICQEYLPQQPGHMSGHIVYGQALFEAGRFDDARAVFETALTLDPENLIALRHLGDISREGGDAAAARGWYQRVLDADPRNEEIASLIAVLDESPDVSSTAPTPISTPSVQEWASPEEPDREDDSALTLSDVPTVEIPQMGGGGAAPRAPEPAVEYPYETAPTESPLPDLETTAAAVGGYAPPSFGEPEDIPLELPTDIFGGGHRGSAPAEPPAPPAEFRLSMAIESAAGVEPSDGDDLEREGSPVEGLVPSTFDDPGALAGLEPTSFGHPAAAGDSPSERDAGVTSAFELETAGAESAGGELPFIDDESAELAAMAGYAPPAGESAGAAAPFVTETMAELYLRQGHREEAIAVYRQLIAQRPGDAGLRARLDEVERGPRTTARGPSIRDFLGAFAARRPGGWEEFGGPDDGAQEAEAPAAESSDGGEREPAPTSARPSAPVGGRASGERGGSIDALFPGAANDGDDAAAERLARAFAGDDIGARDEAALAGAPARTATTELSLDHVFRERGATPAQGQPSFSFDQFFAHGAAAHDDAEAEHGGGGAAAPPDDDIQQFNAWLEGLKKS